MPLLHQRTTRNTLLFATFSRHVHVKMQPLNAVLGHGMKLVQVKTQICRQIIQNIDIGEDIIERHRVGFAQDTCGAVFEQAGAIIVLGLCPVDLLPALLQSLQPRLGLRNRLASYMFTDALANTCQDALANGYENGG